MQPLPRVVSITLLCLILLVTSACRLVNPSAVETMPPALLSASPAPTLRPTATTANLSGQIWADECQLSGVGTAAGQVLSPDCVVAPDGSYQANGLFDPGERNLPGVQVDLGAGDCPATGLASTTTDANGGYNFNDLPPGAYCLSINPQEDPNAALLQTGRWTVPPSDQAAIAVTLSAGDQHAGVDFAWQFMKPNPPPVSGSGTNLFAELTGSGPQSVLPAPQGWLVAPCPGASASLCLTQGQETIGKVELSVFPLESDRFIQQALNKAYLPDKQGGPAAQANTAAVQKALQAYTRQSLDRLQASRQGQYTPEMRFARLEAALTTLGGLPAVRYGFEVYNPQNEVFEHWISYVGVDNLAIYRLTAFYNPDLQGAFHRDADLQAFQPYLDAIVAGLKLPVLEAAPALGSRLAAGPHFVVQGADGGLRLVDMNGDRDLILPEAAVSLSPPGFDNTAQIADNRLYARAQGDPLRYYRFDLQTQSLDPLEFILQPLVSHLVVRPLQAGSPFSLAWDSFRAPPRATARLILAGADGTGQTVGVENTYLSQPPAHLVPWSWGPDGRLYYTQEPLDQPPPPPFAAATNLWAYDPVTQASQELISNDQTRDQLCLLALDPVKMKLVHLCDGNQLSILDLTTQQVTHVSLPDGLPEDRRIGSLHFNPDGGRLAFAIFTGDLQHPQGFVAVSDSLQGSSRLVTGGLPDTYFSIITWLDNQTLLLQASARVPNGWPAVYAAKVDGSSLVKLADGTFLGLIY